MLHFTCLSDTLHSNLFVRCKFRQILFHFIVTFRSVLFHENYYSVLFWNIQDVVYGRKQYRYLFIKLNLSLVEDSLY